MTLSLGKKITLVTMPPLVAFTVFATWNLYKKWQDLQAYSAMVRTAALVEATAAFVQDIQRERTLTVAYMGKDVALAELQAHREKVDAHLKPFRAALEDRGMDAARREAGLGALEAFRALRAGVDSGKYTEQQVLDGFMPVVEPIINLEVDLRTLDDVDEMKSRVVAISTIERAKDAASRIRVRMVDYLGSNEPLKLAQLEMFAELWAGMEGPLRNSNLVMTEKGRERLKTFIASSPAWNKFRQTFEMVMVRASVGHYGQDPKEFLKSTAPATEELTQILKDETSALSAQAQSSRQATLAGFTSLAFFTLSLIVGLMFAVWFVTRAILKPIMSSIEMLSSSSGQVGQASQELQRASEQVASGATQAASSLQETTSSLEEINSMIQSNANNAAKASDLSGTSEGVAQKGRESVQEVARAIGNIQQNITNLIQHITQSNQRIGQIAQVISEIGNKTKVINDIVFQTKLLAFNASVEAARAGEHGKGFAVVAEEVGNLAQMSGNAAKEITNMLDASVEQVKTVITETQANMEVLVRQGTESIDNGVRITRQCEEVLAEIVSKAALLKTVVSDISRASMEQAAGTQQITSAISELDQVTHMNATSSNQVSHSSEAVAQQSLALREVVKALTVAVMGGRGGATNFTQTMRAPNVPQMPKARAARTEPKASEFSRAA